MRAEEATRLSEVIVNLNIGRKRVCLNIGSSTGQFRRTEQPHIHLNLFEPLQRAGFQIVHCDLKGDEGVDLVGDVFDAGFQSELSSIKAELVLCCNLLEHLRDPHRFSQICGNLVDPGAYLVVTVPLSYPYHADPIDTLLRLSPEELAAYFPKFNVIHGEVVKSQSFLQEVFSKPRSIAILSKHFLRVLMPFYRPTKWRSKAHRMLWLFRPYLVSLVVFQKPT